MASGNGDLWTHLAKEMEAVRVDVCRVYERMGRVGKVLGRVAIETRKRFDDQQAQLRALDERLRAIERHRHD